MISTDLLSVNVDVTNIVVRDISGHRTCKCHLDLISKGQNYSSLF